MLMSLVGSEMCIRDSGGSYLSQGSYELVWGVPSLDAMTTLDITWPDGKKQSLAIGKVATEGADGFSARVVQATPVSYTHLTLPTSYPV